MWGFPLLPASPLHAGDASPAHRSITAHHQAPGRNNTTGRDYEQIALQLTGHARRGRRRSPPPREPASQGQRTRALADVVLDEAEGRLSVPLEGTVRGATARVV
ncbi:hypothetical protein SGPA1_40688 [Streptomyces misionensis JCM 4497]